MDSFLQTTARVLRVLLLTSLLASAACNEYNGTEPWPDVYLPESQIDRPKGGVDAGARDGAVGDAGNGDSGVSDAGSDGSVPDASAGDGGMDGAANGDADAASDAATDAGDAGAADGGLLDATAADATTQG